MGAQDPTTIIAISTPRGSGGVGLVRLSGSRALEIGRLLFDAQPCLGVSARHVSYGRVIDGKGRAVDVALAWYLAAPSTYTGEDVVEISAHGSDAVLELVVDRGIELGARQAEPGEFTRRAFLNGRMDLMQAEAVADLIHTQSSQGLRVAYGVLGGQLSRRVRSLKGQLVDALSRLEGMLDFVEEVSTADVGNVSQLVSRVAESARSLGDSFADARVRLNGFRVVLVGEPNVGKSTLLNALLGQDRSIVTDTPGTTRDWVEGQVNWAGQTICLVDTAGLRKAEGTAEEAGILRTREQIMEADLVLEVLDVTREEQTRRTVLSEGADDSTITVLSKADLPHSEASQVAHDTEAIRVSAVSGEGLQRLQEVIVNRLPKDEGSNGAPSRERHREALGMIERCALRATDQIGEDAWELAATELQAALRQTGELLGEGVDEAVLDRIFADFCIGK